ncbi:MAG: hypothetical protein VKI83_03235 [Synechococcaceae cyanobacterium]|nr:hypothetical protein [Synechococcaceae cyanobacterium]
MFERSERTTRRRSSAGPAGPVAPIAPQRPQPRPRLRDTPGPIRRGEGRPEGGSIGGARPTFLTLRDHGKVYVADLPRLSDGQLSQIAKEAQEVLDSLNRRLHDLEDQLTLSQLEQDTRIRATTKRDVTERVLAAIAQEQELRRSNPALRAAAGESLARAFLQLARHRLPGATFDSLLQEALAACAPGAGQQAGQQDPQVIRLLQRAEAPQPPQAALPVVLTPDPPPAASA